MAKFITKYAVALLISVFCAFIAQMIWNDVLVFVVSGIKTVTLFQMWAIVILCEILFKKLD